MDYVGVNSIKQSYAQYLLDEQETEKSLTVYNKDFVTPVFEGCSVQAEDEPVLSEINSAMQDIAIDLTALNKELTNAASSYASLVNTFVTRITAINNALAQEEERIYDLNMICSTYQDFSSVKTLTPMNTTGNCSYENSTFMAASSDVTTTELTVTNIVGNGYIGNEYVYDELAEEFASEENSTGIYTYLTDRSPLTVFEYSRINWSGEAPATLPDFINRDNEEARCVITLNNTDNQFNMLRLVSDSNITVENVQYSADDGVTYTSCLGSAIEINNPDLKYSDPDYAYGTGIISFPSTNYVKVTLKSSEVTDETIADKNSDGSIKIYENAYRHVIPVNDIYSYSGTYSTAKIISEELITTPLESIAVFANEYIPSFFEEEQDYVTYVLTVNGIDYEVVPVNSNKRGTKVIRFSDSTIDADYVQHIGESIKTAKLTVVIEPYAGATPYVSNLKICYGKVAE